MSLLPLFIDCTNTDLSVESLFKTTVVTGDDGLPVVACTLTDNNGFTLLDCDAPDSVEDLFRQLVLANGTINFTTIPC